MWAAAGDLRRREAILAAPIWAGLAVRLILPGLPRAISPAQAAISRPEVLTATTVEASEEGSALAVSMPSAGRTTTAMTTPTTTLMAIAAGNGSWFRRSTACNGNWSTSASKDRSEAARLRQHGAALLTRDARLLFR